MAILFEDALKKDISSKKPSCTYLLFGNDGFLKKIYFEKLINISFDGDPFFNLQKFEGSCDLQEVYNAIEQFPMMADRKCVTLTDFDFEDAEAKEFNKLCELLSSSHDECVFILRFDSLEFDDKKSEKFKKLISATEKSGGKVIQLDHKNQQELVSTLCAAATKRGCKLDANSARYLTEVCGSDLNTLKNELDKLCFYVKNGNIDKKAIDEIAVKTVEESVFDLAKNIFDANPTAALNMLDSLFFMRVNSMTILSVLAASFVDLYRVFAAKNASKSIQYVAENFKYNKREFVLRRCVPLLNGFNTKKFSLCFDALKAADKAIKSSGSDERCLLEELVIKLIYIIVKGEAFDKG